MNTSKRLRPYLIISVLCFAAIGWLLYDFFAHAQKPEFTVSASDVIPEYDVTELASAALEAKIAAPIAEFNPSAGAPFRAFGSYISVAPSSRKPPAGETKAKTRRLPFILRGIMRDPPYAIIEDARGETHIKARGEFIHNAQIISVNNNSVFIKDSIGIHELTVEESR